MGHDITRKPLGISHRTFGDPRHVTVDTAHLIGQMNLVPEFCLLVVTVLTERARGLLPGLAQLDNTFMGIMTNNTINNDMFTLEKLLILLMIPDGFSILIQFDATPISFCLFIGVMAFYA